MSFRSSFFQPQREEDVRIEITSLIDIVFLLLIFFMVSTTFISVPGMEVSLPRAEAAKIEREKREINVVVNREGKIFLNRAPVESSDFLNVLREKVPADGSDTMVIVRGDQGVSYGLVVKVMDLVRKAGIRRLAIATELPTTPGGK